MAIADVRQSQRLTAWSFAQRLRDRIADMLSGEHAVIQRMAGAAFAIRIAGAGIMFISQALLARWLGSYEFGTYIYVWTWLLLAGDLVHLGLPLTAQRFIPEYTEAKTDGLLRGYLSASRWLTLAVSGAVAAIAAGAVWALRSRIDSNLVAPLVLACVAVTAYALTF
ncbi:MAG: oligosaccharide flippase family protein, partial [Pseudolabrys sp.]